MTDVPITMSDAINYSKSLEMSGILEEKNDALTPGSEPMIVSVVGIRKVDDYKLNALRVMADAAEKPDFRVVVKLVPEPDNQYDRKAVRVMINDLQVGYLPKKEQATLEQRQPQVFQGCEAKIYRWGTTHDGPYIEITIG